jgi:glycosyltransferase involved in cell wall biosynthesis
MKILLVTDSYPPLIGGGTRAAQQLARRLTGRGHTVTVATAWQRGQPAFENEDGISVHRLRGLVSRVSKLSADPVRYTPPPFPDPELSWRLARLIRRTSPDVVHCYGWLTYSCLFALRRTNIPLVIAMRDYGNACAVRTLVRQGREQGEACSGPGWGKCLECAGAFYGQPKGAIAVASVLGQRRAIRRRADALHNVSRYCEQITQRFVFAGRPIRSRVIPDFRDDGLASEPDPQILARLPEEPFILFVGSFRRIKGDQLLLDAYSRLAAPPPMVMVGGRGPEPLPHFPAGVTPLFDVPHATVMAIWDRALFGVCPSVVAESFGNAVHEGMSRGKAVIGTRPSGHEDMLEHDRNGLLVPRGDLDALVAAIERLIDDPQGRERMGRHARSAAQSFTAEAVMPELEALLQGTAAHRA